MRFNSIAAFSAVCPPKVGKNSIRFFALHDRLDHLGRDRFDIGAIGEFWIGHDGGRVGIHQHDLVAFLSECLARLHAGIIKFAALPDDDWTGADQQNFLSSLFRGICASADSKRNHTIVTREPQLDATQAVT